MYRWFIELAIRDVVWALSIITTNRERRVGYLFALTMTAYSSLTRMQHVPRFD